MGRSTGYPATEEFKELPKVASGPAAGGTLAFSLVSGDVFRIDATDYLVTRIVSQDGRVDMTVVPLDGSTWQRIFSKGGVVTRGTF